MTQLTEWFVNQIISKDIWDVVGHAIALAALIQVYIYMLMTKKQMLLDLRGKDKIWQFVEFTGPIWAILFPAVVCAAIFSIPLPKELWTSLEIVFFVAVLGKRAEQLILARYGGGSSKHTTTETHSKTTSDSKQEGSEETETTKEDRMEEGT